MPTSLTLLHHVLAATTTNKKSGSGFYSIFFLVAIFGVVYFIFLRPARNRQRQAVTARRQVEVGDEITTTAGLIATVVAVEDDFLTLEVAPGVHCRYVPAAVLRVNNAEEELDGDESDESERDVSTHEVIDEPVDDEPTASPPISQPMTSQAPPSPPPPSPLTSPYEPGDIEDSSAGPTDATTPTTPTDHPDEPTLA